MLEARIGGGITGQGDALKVSLFDGMADWMNVPLLYYEGTGQAPERPGLAHPSICPYGAFETKDHALVLISIQNEREWMEFRAKFRDEPDPRRRTGFETNVIRVATVPWSTRMWARHSLLSRAIRRPPNWVPPTPPLASSTMSRRSPITRRRGTV